MPAMYENNAVATLAEGVESWDTQLRMASGLGSRFPEPDADQGQYFHLTLENEAGTLEIVRVTARSGDLLTIERGMEGTAASSFAAGDRAELRLTAAGLGELVNQETLAPENHSRIKGTWWVSASSSVTDHGDPVQTGSLAWVAAQIGAGQGHVALPGGHTYVLSTSLALGGNLALELQQGAILQVEAGAVLTLDCAILAPASRIFSGLGEVGGTLAGEAALPQWFGAAADGTTDDTDALQKALAFPDVLLPRGTYLVSQPLSLAKDQSLRGEAVPAGYIDWTSDFEQESPTYSARASILQYPQGSHGALFDGRDHLSLSCLVFRAGQARTASDLLFQTPASHLRIQDCRFENLDGILRDDTESVEFGHLEISNCRFFGCGDHLFRGVVVDCQVSDCTFTSCGICFLLAEGSGFNLFTGNRFEWNEVAVDMYRSRSNSLSANLFDAKSQTVVRTSHGSGSLVPGNVFWRNGRDGSDTEKRSHLVIRESSSHNLVQDNVFLKGGPDGSTTDTWPKYVVELPNSPGTVNIFKNNDTADGCVEMPVFDPWDQSHEALVMDDIHVKGIGNPNQSNDQLVEMVKHIARVAAEPVRVHIHEDRKWTNYTTLTPDRVDLVGHNSPTLTDSLGRAHYIRSMEKLTYGRSFGGPSSQMSADGPPSLGYWQAGSLVWSTAPAPGGYVGWVCTTEGAPGTWKGFGQVQS